MFHLPQTFLTLIHGQNKWNANVLNIQLVDFDNQCGALSAEKRWSESERFRVIPYANQSVWCEGKWRWDVCARWWRWPEIAERTKLKLYKFQIQDKSKRKTLSEESHWNDLKRTKRRRCIARLNKWIFPGSFFWGEMVWWRKRMVERTKHKHKRMKVHLKRQTQPKRHIFLFRFVVCWCLSMSLFCPGFNNYYSRWDFSRMTTTMTTKRRRHDKNFSMSPLSYIT